MQNTGGMSVNRPTGLLLVPAGITPASFAAVTGSGLFHTAGTPLTIPAGQTVNGSGTINDPVICQGTITYPSGYGVNLANGLVLASGGTANLGNGTLNVNGPNSGMAGGTLSATYKYWPERHLYPVRRNQFPLGLLSRQPHLRRRDLQLKRRLRLRRLRVHRPLRHGNLQPIRRHEHHHE